MAKRRAMHRRPIDTIWEVNDDLWERLEQMINERYPPKPTGRPRSELRPAVNGIIFRMRTGCQWNRLPKKFGDDSTVHRWFQRWCRDGFFRDVWSALASDCDELGEVDWQWQSADASMGKARFGGRKSAPIRPIAASRAPRKASSSKPAADRWEGRLHRRTSTIPSFWRPR